MNDFEKRLSDISHGITEKTVLPDAEQLLDTAKKESATKGKKIERRNAFRRNFIPAVAMIMLSVVFISGVYYYITHGSLRNPGSTNPTTESNTQPITLSIDPNPLSYSETEQDGLVLSVSLDKTDYLIGEPIDITFALENNSGKSIYQECSQPSEDNKFSVIAVICDVDENPLYQYTCGNGIDDIAIYELKDGERVERNFKYSPSDFSDAENQIINPGIYSVKVSAHYTFTDFSGGDFEPTVIETECAFQVGDSMTVETTTEATETTTEEETVPTTEETTAPQDPGYISFSSHSDKPIYKQGEKITFISTLENNSISTLYQELGGSCSACIGDFCVDYKIIDPEGNRVFIRSVGTDAVVVETIDINTKHESFSELHKDSISHANWPLKVGEYTVTASLYGCTFVKPPVSSREHNSDNYFKMETAFTFQVVEGE